MNGGLRWGLVLVVAVLGVSLFLPPVSDRLAGQGSELLVNGGFEGPIGSPWYSTPNLLAGQVTEPRYEGSFAAKLTVNNSQDGEFWQVVSPAPGAGTYELSAWVMGGDGVGSIHVIAEWYESGDATGSFIRDYWLVYTGTASLLSGQVRVDGPVQSVRVRVQVGPAAGSLAAAAFIDGASLQFLGPPTPTPSAAASATPGAGPPGPTPTPGPAHYEPGSLIFNELLYDPGIAGCGTDCEWVELVNTTGAPIDLGGWTLADNGRSDPLPAAVIPAGGVAVIAASPDAVPVPADGGFVLVVMPTGRIGNGLNNDGDRLVLKAPDGTVVAALSYGTDPTYSPALPAVRAGWSLERLPAVTGQFRPTSQPSPGRLSRVCCLGWLPAVVGRR